MFGIRIRDLWSHYWYIIGPPSAKKQRKKCFAFFYSCNTVSSIIATFHASLLIVEKDILQSANAWKYRSYDRLRERRSWAIFGVRHRIVPMPFSSRKMSLTRKLPLLLIPLLSLLGQITKINVSQAGDTVLSQISSTTPSTNIVGEPTWWASGWAVRSVLHGHSRVYDRYQIREQTRLLLVAGQRCLARDFVISPPTLFLSMVRGWRHLLTRGHRCLSRLLWYNRVYMHLVSLIFCMWHFPVILHIQYFW